MAPVLTITGPRQSGKTTLVRAVFGDKHYVNLEDPGELSFARDDPRRFLARFPDGAVLDEVQRCPELLSYIQVRVDERPEPGLFVLTGSQHFGLLERVSQSLAGRVTLCELLPLSLGELDAAGYAPASLDSLLWTGGYPAIHDRNLPPHVWLSDYVATYVERDVRQVQNVRNLDVFQRFLSLCAGYTGQLVNLSALGSDCGVSLNTVKAWLSVLQASYVVMLLEPHHRNFRKRIVRRPKLYFFDTGLAASLSRIGDPEHLATHPARGALFENWVLVEVLKRRLNAGKRSNVFFWRNHAGLEIDLCVDLGVSLRPVECKSGATVASDWFEPLARWRELAGSAAAEPWLVYGGDERYRRSGVEVVPWRRIGDLLAGV